MVWDIQHIEDSEQKDDLIDQSINHECVYRTALATPGMLNRSGQIIRV